MTLVEELERNSIEAPSKRALVFHDAALTYRELNASANRLASALKSAGIRRGDRVALMLPRVPELIIGFLGSAKIGAIAAPMNFENTPEEIARLLKGMAPTCVIVYSDFVDHAQRAFSSGYTPPIAICAGKGEDKGLIRWDDFLKNGSPVDPNEPVGIDDVVYLNYTSGSTGGSKGAITTHSNIYWNTLASIDAFGLTQDDVHICMFAPFAHPHELIARPLLLGGTIVLVDRLYPKSIAEAISTHKVTCMMGLSPMYENLLELLEQRDYDLSSLRVPESGGMYTRPELIERFRQKIGAPIYPVWGSTETTGIAIATRPGEKSAPGSIGRPCLSYDVRLVDEDGRDVADGEPGELLFKGPAVVSAYFEKTESNPFADNWYHSGDMAYKVDGAFHFVDRKFGMMKVAGLKVYPMEIEKVLADMPGVKEATVVSIKDDLRGEVPKAIICLADGANPMTSRDVSRFLKERLANYKLPRIIEFRDALPKTSSGKINRKALQMEHS